jgi:hypothetical protein
MDWGQAAAILVGLGAMCVFVRLADRPSPSFLGALVEGGWLALGIGAVAVFVGRWLGA